MKIYLMTDLEGVAGVMDFENWCVHESRYYEQAKEFLTLEVNAAVSGFFDAGALEIVVADGHGPGAINSKLIDPRVELMRGWPGVWPLLLDKSYDAIAWVGQHAKAGTEYAHLAHTQHFDFVDDCVNEISIGEFGQEAMCASELGVRSIFGSGDLAFTKEAQALIPGIETVAVKRGTTPGKGDELPFEAYMKCNYAAIHTPPERARGLIKAGAFKAVKRALSEDFGIIEMKPPFNRVMKLRSDAVKPARTLEFTHSESFISLLNLPQTGR